MTLNNVMGFNIAENFAEFFDKNVSDIVNASYKLTNLIPQWIPQSQDRCKPPSCVIPQEPTIDVQKCRKIDIQTEILKEIQTEKERQRQKKRWLSRVT